MKKEFAISDLNVGQLNALVKNIMRQIGSDDPIEAVRLINSGEYIIDISACRWREHDGVIYFSVTSYDISGPEWMERLYMQRYDVSTYAKQVLYSNEFRRTCDVTYEIAVLKGKLFSDSDRITKNIRAEAAKRKLSAPNSEVACLIREMFTDKELGAMGLSGIAVMHEPIKDSDGDLSLLSVNRYDHCPHLDTNHDNPDYEWDCGNGFAFTVSQVNA